MPSELFVPPVSHGSEHHRLITLCGNSKSGKVGDALVGICLAYYITANINRNGISAPDREFPRQRLVTGTVPAWRSCAKSTWPLWALLGREVLGNLLWKPEMSGVKYIFP